jgi:hypothetical protein
MAHKCPVRGCTAVVSASLLACKTHWYALPRDMRDEVWAGYRARAEHGPHRHAAAVRAALDWWRANA